MKRFLMVLMVVALAAAPAMADHIGVYTDQVGGTGNCEMVPPPFSPFSIYVVHQTGGATGSQFKVNNESGYNLSASVKGGFLAIGDAFTDLSLAYGSCNAGPAICVVQLNGFGFPVPGQVCGLVEVIPAPGKAAVLAVNCDFAEIPATGGQFRFNADTTCPCVAPNPVDESTWGGVKALYR